MTVTNIGTNYFFEWLLDALKKQFEKHHNKTAHEKCVKRLEKNGWILFGKKEKKVQSLIELVPRMEFIVSHQRQCSNSNEIIPRDPVNAIYLLCCCCLSMHWFQQFVTKHRNWDKNKQTNWNLSHFFDSHSPSLFSFRYKNRHLGSSHYHECWILIMNEWMKWNNFVLSQHSWIDIWDSKIKLLRFNCVRWCDFLDIVEIDIF